MSAQTPGSTSCQLSGGKSRRTGGGAAGDAQDPGEGEPIGIEAGGPGGPGAPPGAGGAAGTGPGGSGAPGDHRGEGVVHEPPAPDLLVHQLGQPRAQDPTRPAQMGL